MEPPIQLEYFRSDGAMMLIFIVLGANAVISFCIRSAKPGYKVEPPDNTMLAYKSLRISQSQFMILFVCVFVDTTRRLQSKERWLEQCLRTLKSIVANVDDLTVGKYEFIMK